VSDRLVEECRILEYCGELLPITLEGEVIDICPIDKYLSLTWLIESHEELDNRRLAAPCMSDEGDALSLHYREVDI
jgi:hypothetical protein